MADVWVSVSTFWAFVFAVFWGTCAGVVNRTSPFEVSKCGEPASSFPERWQSWLNRCHEIVALQGIAWALCKYCLFLRSFIQSLIWVY
jgi:hypothetical protein